MAKDPIKKAENGTYYFRANLGYHPVTGSPVVTGFVAQRELFKLAKFYLLCSVSLVFRS